MHCRYQIVAVAMIVGAIVPLKRTMAQALKPAEVPVAVRRSCQTRFPGLRNTEWKRKSDGAFEAEFTLKGVGIAVKFDSTGTWLETEADLKPGQVPASVVQAVGREFKGYETIERQRVDASGGRTLYEIHVKNAREVVKAQFDSSGALVARTAKPRRYT